MPSYPRRVGDDPRVTLVRVHVSIALLVKARRHQRAVCRLQEPQSLEMGPDLALQPSLVTRQRYDDRTTHTTTPKAPGRSRASSYGESAWMFGAAPKP